jgi:hemoglobin/transferrin/lactoferrin receptor protein
MEIGNLTVTPQLRYEWQSLTGSDNGLATDGQKFKSSDWSGALAVRYGFDNGVGVFGTVAYNTNLPILDDLSSATKIGVTEKATTYEAGLSYSGIGVFSEEDKLDGKVTLFRTNVWNNTTYTNPLDSTSTQTYLAANPSNPFAGITPDSDQMNLQGVELELSYVHTEFYADFNASRVRAEWGDGTWFNNAPADVAQLTLGKRFMDEQLDLSLEIKHAWATNRNVNRSFGATGVTNVFAEQHKSHTTYDLNFAYVPTSGALEGFEVRGGVDNVTDVAYQPYLSSRAARGRTFKLSVAKVF